MYVKLQLCGMLAPLCVVDPWTTHHLCVILEKHDCKINPSDTTPCKNRLLTHGWGHLSYLILVSHDPNVSFFLPFCNSLSSTYISQYHAIHFAVYKSGEYILFCDHLFPLCVSESCILVHQAHRLSLLYNVYYSFLCMTDRHVLYLCSCWQIFALLLSTLWVFLSSFALHSGEFLRRGTAGSPGVGKQ